MIRGAIAFGLVLKIDKKTFANADIIATTTLVLVIFTTVFFGSILGVHRREAGTCTTTLSCKYKVASLLYALTTTAGRATFSLRGAQATAQARHHPRGTIRRAQGS